MTPPFSDELISAYLDGELTPDQQTLVEEQLSQRADLRRMCDDLRLLRRTLQAMPVAEPPDNLAERVLRQAERRMLAGEPAGGSPFQPAAERAETAARPRVRRPVRAWGIVASAVAAVAAVGLVMIVLPRNGARDVAQAPTARPESTPAPEAAAYATGAEAGRGLSTREERYGADADVPSLGTALEVQPTDRADSVERSVRRDALARGMIRSAPLPPTPGGGVAAPAAIPSPPAGEAGIAPPAPAGTDDVAGMGGAGGMVGGAGVVPGPGAAAGAMGYPGMSAGQPAANESNAMYFGAGAAPAAPGMGMMMGKMASDAPAMSAPAAAAATPESLSAPGMPGMPGAGLSPADSLRPDAERALSEADLAARPDIVEQIVSQLHQDQMLLVRVQLPERELSRTLVELSNSNRMNVLTTSGSVVPVEQTTLADGTSDARAAGRFPALQVPARDETELRQLQLGLMTPNTVIVDGSSEQIRQSLNGLTTRHGVEIQPVTLDPLADRKGVSQQLGDTVQSVVEKKAHPAELPPAGLGKSKENATTAREQAKVVALAEQSDVADDKLTIIYLLLRLWNEPAAAAPAEPAGPAENPP